MKIRVRSRALEPSRELELGQISGPADHVQRAVIGQLLATVLSHVLATAIRIEETGQSAIVRVEVRP